MLYSSLTAVMRLATRMVLDGKLHLEGMDNVPASGAVLFVGNHIGTIDPPLTGAFLPRRDLSYMAKEEYFRSAPSRLLFRSYRAFPVSRGTADRAALTTAIDVLRRGEALLVYPEGTRSPDAGMIAPKAGVGHILRRCPDAAVVPIAISGSEKVMHKGDLLPRRADLTLRVGPPLVHVLVDEKGRPRSQDEITAYVMYAVASMLPEPYRGIYRNLTLEQALAEARDARTARKSRAKDAP